ncbi:MAG: DUF998 domain-containing protein, partial [Treponema sp.]|nr:DUF998 domain-containing protein [Treponema sp.]
SLFGAIGVIFYFLHIVFGSIFYEGYNPFAQAISDLTASNSPSKNIASLLTFIYGIFSVIFTFLFFIYFRKKINKMISSGSCFLFIMNVISSFGYSLFPLSTAGFNNTFQDKMHVVVTGLVVAFTILALIFLGFGFIKTREYKYMGIISLCTFLLLIFGVILLNIVPKEYFGAAERINVYSIVIYTGILSLWMHKYIKMRDNTEHEKDG